jgi:mannosylglycerate hydrolase
MFTIHVVSHTHWDREWYLTFQQFRFRLVEMMDQLLALLDTDPNYRHFMLDGQAIVLEDYLEVRPEREEDIRRYVQEGRLIIGPWYILPDEFLVSPEATVRNLLVGERVCRRFGPRMRIGYLPDPFGHIGQMPQILHGFGIDAACLWRGVGDQPTELRWRAPDGSTVDLLHLRDSYSNAAWLSTDEAGFVQGLAELRDSLVPHASTSHVLAMQGTDHMRPRADLPRLLAAADARLKDTRVIHSTLARYLAAVRDELGQRESPLPTIEGELRSPQRAHLLPGVLSTRMWIKQRNHACQTLLERWAEPFSAIAAQLGPEASGLTPFVDQAWTYLLQNHPHDSICGCSVDQVHREMVTRFDWCEQIGQEVTRWALRAIVQKIDVSTPAIVVFNPASAPRTDLVHVKVEFPLGADCLLLDPAGRPVPYRVLGRQRQEFYGMEVDRDGFALLVAQFESTAGQISDQFTFRRVEVAVEGDTAYVHLIVSQGEGAPPGSLDEALAGAQALLADESVQHYRVRVLEDEGLQIQFVARDVPPLGYLTYTLGAGRGELEPKRSGQSVSSIENEHFRVVVNPEDGTLTITDKATGRALQGCNRFLDGGDRGDEYNYCQPEHDRTVDRPAAAPAVQLLSADEVGATLEIALAYRVPVSLASGDRAFRSDETISLPIVTHVTLTPGVHRVDFETTVENRARDHRLRVCFPTGLRVDAACADGHFDVVERSLDLPTEIEGWAERPASTYPQRAFVDVSDGTQGVMLANRGLPEYEVLRMEDGAEIVLTLLRCVGQLSYDDLHCRQGPCGPGDATPEAQCPGRHTFRYSLIPHTGDYRQAHALAYGFQTDLRAVYTDAKPDSPVPSSVERAEGTVLSETERLALSGAAGLPTALSFLTVEPSTLEVSAVKAPEEGAGLIVRCWNVGREPVEGTLRLWRPFRRALQVNLAEERVAELGRDANGVTLSVRGRQVVTVRFEL